MRVFISPCGRRKEIVSGASPVLTLVGGMLYLAYKRMWFHALMAGVIVFVPALLAGAWVLIFTLPMVRAAYAMGIQDILALHYLDRGWTEIPVEHHAARKPVRD